MYWIGSISFWVSGCSYCMSGKQEVNYPLQVDRNTDFVTVAWSWEVSGRVDWVWCEMRANICSSKVSMDVQSVLEGFREGEWLMMESGQAGEELRTSEPHLPEVRLRQVRLTTCLSCRSCRKHSRRFHSNKQIGRLDQTLEHREVSLAIGRKHRLLLGNHMGRNTSNADRTRDY